MAQAHAPADADIKACLDTERELATFHYCRDPKNILVYVQDREFPFVQAAPYSAQEWDGWRGYRVLLEARSKIIVKERRRITASFLGYSNQGRPLPLLLGPSLLMCS